MNGSFSNLFCSLKQILRLVRLVVEKTQKNQKYWSNILQQTFLKALNKGVKQKRDQGSMQAHKNVGGIFKNTPFEIKFSKASQKIIK